MKHIAMKLKSFLSTGRGKIISVAIAVCIIGSVAVLTILSTGMKSPAAKALYNSSEVSMGDSSSWYIPPITSSTVDSSSAAPVSSAAISTAATAPSVTSTAPTSQPPASTPTQPTSTPTQPPVSTPAQPKAPASSTAPTTTVAPATGANLAGLASYGEYSYPYGVEETNAQFRANEPAYKCDQIAADLIAEYASKGFTFDTNAGNVYRSADHAGLIRGKLTGQGETHVADVDWHYGSDGKYKYDIVIKLS